MTNKGKKMKMKKPPIPVSKPNPIVQPPPPVKRTVVVENDEEVSVEVKVFPEELVKAPKYLVSYSCPGCDIIAVDEGDTYSDRFCSRCRMKMFVKVDRIEGTGPK